MRENDLEILKHHMAHPPVQPKDIIEGLGVRFVTEDMENGASGCIQKYRDGGYRISVNAAEGPQRRRFTAAHELAHYLLHRDLLDERGHLDRLYGGAAANPSAPLSPLHEVQANKLAAQILMPAPQIRARVGGGKPDVEALASEFDVSPAAMRIRLKTLGFEV
ncbi:MULTISPECIES: ImmA/IrrE family metallo-endopeptidase [Afifella]|uniref:ImmA/IrrE family metallo-endopeptidase n=1 Tax=Afifella TaxID=643217 RepID=UPI000FE437FC|nr:MULTISPECIES: ImmA/IrrE family metallo-endopeptidase [Afifella]MCT8266784.1 ImmA/IrrE family metallo-endopeptidase [Afifella sp. JA880]